MNIVQNVWCIVAHRRFITTKGEGDWNRCYCSKCDIKWMEPRL